jgi:biopolymer transport protein ExbB/TolQ
MWALFQKGGPVMWPLAILSILTVAVVIEKIFGLRNSKVIQARS